MKTHRIIALVLVLILMLGLSVGLYIGSSSHANTGNATIDKMTVAQLGDALVRALDDRNTYKTTSEQLQEQVDELNEKVQDTSAVKSHLPAANTIVYKADVNAIYSNLADKSNAVTVTDQDGKVTTRVTLNSNPTFSDGKADGNLMIVNNETSHSPQLVRLYTIPDNQLIYSGGLAAGQAIEKSTLLVDLPKGEYACFAVFYSVDDQGACHLSSYSKPVTITVLA